MPPSGLAWMPNGCWMSARASTSATSSSPTPDPTAVICQAITSTGRPRCGMLSPLRPRRWPAPWPRRTARSAARRGMTARWMPITPSSPPRNMATWPASPPTRASSMAWSPASTCCSSIPRSSTTTAGCCCVSRAACSRPRPGASSRRAGRRCSGSKRTMRRRPAPCLRCEKGSNCRASGASCWRR